MRNARVTVPIPALDTCAAELERIAPYVLPCEDRDDLVKALFEAGFRPADR